MSEREPYDEAVVNEVFEWRDVAYYEDGDPSDPVRALYSPGKARRVARMARSEHALRLEAEARVERLERERRDFVFTVNRWFKNHAGCDCEACWSYSASVVAESVVVAALETGGEG